MRRRERLAARRARFGAVDRFQEDLLAVGRRIDRFEQREALARSKVLKMDAVDGGTFRRIFAPHDFHRGANCFAVGNGDLREPTRAGRELSVGGEAQSARADIGSKSVGDAAIVGANGYRKLDAPALIAALRAFLVPNCTFQKSQSLRLIRTNISMTGSTKRL